MESTDDDKLGALRTSIDKSVSAEKAADLAAEVFKQAPTQLPGTGGDEWKELFEAARQFAAISHEGHKFPDLPEDASCPLCQNREAADGHPGVSSTSQRRSVRQNL